jgi:hypothetical protein
MGLPQAELSQPIKPELKLHYVTFLVGTQVDVAKI